MNLSFSNKNYFRVSFKGIIYFLLLWLLLFLEPINIGVFKISQIWKALVVLAIFIFLFNKKKDSYTVIGMLFAFKYLFYSYIPYGILQAFQEFMEALIFPLVLGFLLVYYRKKPNASEKMIKVLIFLSLFFIYSSVPFLLGLESLNPKTELSKYGLEEFAAKGLLYHIASASKMFSFATIVIFNFYGRFFNSKLNKLFWFITVLLGTYLVYASWARTAWLFFFVGIMISLFYGKKLKMRLVASFVSVLLVVVLSYIYQNNQALRYRLSGGAIYRQNTELSVEQLAAARVPFVLTAIDNFSKENLISQFIGYGQKRGIDLFEKKTNMSIVSHNKTFEILESSGIIALLLYFMFIYKLFKSINRYRPYMSSEKRRLSYVLFFLFVGYYLTSHGSPFWGEIMIALLLISIKFEFFENKILQTKLNKVVS